MRANFPVWPDHLCDRCIGLSDLLDASQSAATGRYQEGSSEPGASDTGLLAADTAAAAAVAAVAAVYYIVASVSVPTLLAVPSALPGGLSM